MLRELLYKIYKKCGTYLNILWVLLKENEVPKRLLTNTVKGLDNLVPLLIDLNRYKDNK
jgi:hypothetical protein